jgi:hypothetical protein
MAKNSKKNPWKAYELILAPELKAAWTDGTFATCAPQGKYPSPVQLEIMLDTLYKQEGARARKSGPGLVVSALGDPTGSVVPLRFIVATCERKVYIDVWTPEIEFVTKTATARSQNGETVLRDDFWPSERTIDTATLH